MMFGKNTRQQRGLIEQGSWDLPLDRPIEIEQSDQRLLWAKSARISSHYRKRCNVRNCGTQLQSVLKAAKSGRTARVGRVFRLAAMMSGRNAGIVWK
jgi:hypothetical protein